MKRFQKKVPKDIKICHVITVFKKKILTQKTEDVSDCSQVQRGTENYLA